MYEVREVEGAPAIEKRHKGNIEFRIRNNEYRTPTKPFAESSGKNPCLRITGTGGAKYKGVKPEIYA